jgi:hypothetical protein
MRSIPRIDSDAAALFGLDADAVGACHALLDALGRDPIADVARQAMALESALSAAALHAALNAPYPWPWLATELDGAMAAQSENFDGFKLFCAIILRSGDGSAEDGLAPAGANAALAGCGACCAQEMTCPSEARAMSHQDKLALAESLGRGQPHQLPRRQAPTRLGAWALPVLYSPSRHGAHDLLDAKERGLLALSMAEALRKALDGQGRGDALLGFGPWSSILNSAPSICAPARLRAKIAELTQTLMIEPSELAVSVSFHESEDAQWMRVALRPNATGFCLDGLDWPAGPGELDAEFDRLLDALENSGVEWCHQVEGTFDQLACPTCGEPVYPAPAHEPWREAALAAGAPPDGSHAH